MTNAAHDRAPRTRLDLGAASARVRLERESRSDGNCYHLTLDNPAKLNVLDSQSIATLTGALARIAADPDARVATWRGEGGRAWIGGADIGEMADLDRASATRFITALHELCAAVRTLPVPVIAVINGYCLGAGMEVAACCDLRVAATHAVFGLPEVQVGIPTVIEGAMTPRLVGLARTQELVLTGRTIDAATALSWGFLNEVAEPSTLETRADEWRALLLAAGPNAVRAQKRLVRQWLELPLDEAIDAGIAAFAGSFDSDEPARYMRRFLDRPRKSK